MYSHRLSLGMAALTLILTVVFHALVVDHPYGFAFAIFVVCLVVALHIIALVGGWQKNSWAYVFLVPVVLGITADALYASDVVRVLGLATVATSLAFFSYWIAAPTIKFREVKSLWSWSFFIETLLPVEGSSGMITKESFGTRGSRVLIGAAVAIPFLIVIGALFAFADPLFGKFLSGSFHPTPAFIIKFMADVIVAIFLGRVTWAMVTRTREQRATKYSAWHPTFDHVILTTYLALLNVLFLVFIVFQFIYFFGGEAYVKSQGLTYADYARSGFFQLLAVAMIVFGITWFMYRMSELRHRWIKILNIALILETGIVIASAIKRLLLYIDAYGLTVSRFWAMTVILVIGFVLLVAVIGAFVKANYATMAKLTFLALLIIFSGILLSNVENFVAQTNVDRYLSDKTKNLDLGYLMTVLSSDAVPAVVRLAQTGDARSTIPTIWPSYCDGLRGCLKYRAQKMKDFGGQDWRNLVWSDYQAIVAVENLK